MRVGGTRDDAAHDTAHGAPASASVASETDHEAPAEARGFRRYFSWELCAALLVMLLVLLPVLRTALINDDQFNTNLRGTLHYQDRTLWQYFWDTNKGWIDVNGRWFPAGILFGGTTFWFIHDFLPYKLFLIGSSLVAAGATFWMLRKLRVSRPVAALILVAVAAATQYRYYYDPHFSFNALTQVVMIEVALAIGWYQLWLTTGRTRWLVLSLLIAFISASTYEAVYLFAPLFVILALRERPLWWPVIRASIGPVVLMVVMLVLSSYLRSRAIAGETGAYAPSYDLREFFYTFGDQFSAAIPLSHMYFDPSRIYTTFSVLDLGWGDMLVGAVSAAVSIALVWKSRWEGWSPLQTGAIGLVLWLIVAATSSLSLRYQGEIIAGLGNVTIYFEEIAFGIVLVSLAGLLLRVPAVGGFAGRHRRSVSIIAGAALGILVMLQHNANGVVVNVQQPLREARITDDEATAAGILDGLPEDRRTSLFLVTYLPYMDSGYYWMHSQRDVDVWLLANAGTADTPRVPRACSLEDGRGGAILQSVQMAGRVTVGFVGIGCRRPTAAARFYLRNADDNVWLTGGDFRGRPFAAPPEALLVRDGDLWRARDPEAIDPSTVTLIPRAVSPVLGAQPGCYPPEGASQWCEKSWRINVAGPPGAEAEVRFVIEETANADALLAVRGGDEPQAVTAKDGRVVKQRVRLNETGGAQLRLRYSGPEFPSPGDPRKLYVRINSLQVKPAG